MTTVKAKPLPGMEETLEGQISAEILRLSKENGELEDRRAAYNGRIDERIAQNDHLMELLRRTKEALPA